MGHFKPKAQGGDMRSHRVEKRASDILAFWDANRDITLEELRAELSKIGLSGLWNLIGKLVDIFQPDECDNYFRSCGYDPE